MFTLKIFLCKADSAIYQVAKTRWALPPKDEKGPSKNGCWSHAVEQAPAMAHRYNRMFIRMLRALRDLRRHWPTVLVQNAGQVSVGEQQVNVSVERNFLCDK